MAPERRQAFHLGQPLLEFFPGFGGHGSGGGSRRISIFLVDKDRQGVTVGRDQPMMGLRDTSHVEFAFDKVELTPANLLGEEGCGLRLIFETLSRIRLTPIGARAVGKATRALSMMIDHARERRLTIGRGLMQDGLDLMGS